LLLSSDTISPSIKLEVIDSDAEERNPQLATAGRGKAIQASPLLLER